MPKFKPKAILSRVLLGESRQKEDSLDYLCAGFERYYLLGWGSHAIRRATDNQDDDDDGRNSICSFSTTATADNLPGTGRTLDMYIFQPLGRRIERVAMRFTIASLHPARIAQYLEPDGSGEVYPGFLDSINLNDAIARICWQPEGSTVVAGMKGLVKQTQSNTINRSASALAALIRVSMDNFRREIYVNVPRIEPIFHLETLVRSHPDKKWFLLLVKLARESVIAARKPLSQKSFDPVLGKEVRQLWPSLESAQKLRQRLIRALEIYRLSGLHSLESTIGESCAICAEAISTWIGWFARGDAYMHILETVNFAVIFILRSIHELADITSIAANRHISLVLRTIVCWIDGIVYKCLNAFYVKGFDMDLVKVDIAFRSLIMDGDTLLPGSFKYNTYTEDLDMHTLPRRYWGEGTAPIQSLIEAAKRRTQLLLRSFDELEREVWGCASQINISTLQFEIHPDPHGFGMIDFGDEWFNYWKRTFERARRVQVPETILTEEFREAQRIGISDPFFREKCWNCYQRRRGSRHKWGQYLRSTMDWDWDLATCMKRLFKVKKQMRGGPSRPAPAPSTAIDVAAGRPGGTLKMSMGDAQEESLPTEVQFEYKTKTGETRYMSFVPAGSGPGFQPNSETAGASTWSSQEQILDPMDAQQISGHRSFGDRGGEQEVENPETGAVSLDVSQPDACEDAQVEESNDGNEWKGPVYDASYDEVRAGEDTISICSLD